MKFLEGDLIVFEVFAACNRAPAVLTLTYLLDFWLVFAQEVCVMLKSASHVLHFVSVILAIALVVASITGAADVVFFLVEVRRTLRVIRFSLRLASTAAACRPLFFA